METWVARNGGGVVKLTSVKCEVVCSNGIAGV
jgi:hypothetical protein